MSEPEVFSRIRNEIGKNDVLLFMKGTPDEPRCGFSAKVVSALRATGVTDFGSFDILSDDAVRQGLKELSNWPTYPQLYVGGELLGGCDIVLELAEAGELREEIDKAAAAAAPADPKAALARRLAGLVRSRPVMLFMKGTVVWVGVI